MLKPLEIRQDDVGRQVRDPGIVVNRRARCRIGASAFPTAASSSASVRCSAPTTCRCSRSRLTRTRHSGDDRPLKAAYLTASIVGRPTLDDPLETFTALNEGP